MGNQHVLVVTTMFLLLFTVQVQGEPTFNYIRYLDSSQATRPLLVDERFVIEISYTRLPEDADNYPDNNLYAHTNGEISDLHYCRFDECNPPEIQDPYIRQVVLFHRSCYCKKVTGNDYLFVINTTAGFIDDLHRGAPLMVHWWPQQEWPENSLQPVYSDMINLPVICPEPRPTLTLLGEDHELEQMELRFAFSSHALELIPGYGIQYSFRVDLAEFVPPYTVTLRTNGVERIRLTNGTTLTSPITDDDVDTERMFTVTVNEATGCRSSRPRSYRVNFFWIHPDSLSVLARRNRNSVK